MNELAQKIAQILGVSADKVGQVYPQMVYVWAFEAYLYIAAGVLCLIGSCRLLALAIRFYQDDADEQIPCWIFGSLIVILGALLILFNLSSALYPEATFVRSLMHQVKP